MTKLRSKTLLKNLCVEKKYKLPIYHSWRNINNTWETRLVCFGKTYNSNEYKRRKDSVDYVAKCALDGHVGFYYICKSGDLNEVERAMNYGENNWNIGFEGACDGKHLELIKLLINKGATNCDYITSKRVNYYINDAILVEEMIERTRRYLIKWMTWACIGCSVDIVHCVINQGANDWQHGLNMACICNRKEIVDLMIEKGANNWNYAFKCSSHKDIAELMIEKGANNWNEIYNKACSRNWRDLAVRTIYKTYETNKEHYDFYNVFDNKTPNKIVDIHVKLFDVNLLK